MAASLHSKVQERYQQIANAPGLHASFETHWIVDRDMRAEFLGIEFHEIGMIVGELREIRTFKNEVNAIDLRTNEDRFRIIIGNHDSRPGKEVGYADSAPDALRNDRVRLTKVCHRTIHELETYLQG